MPTIALVSLALLAGSARAANSRCYVFHNDAGNEIRLDFTSSATSKSGAIPSKTLAAHQKPWNFCVSEGPSVVISVQVVGSGTPGWSGVLIMSSGPSGAPAGDYYIR